MHQMVNSTNAIVDEKQKISHTKKEKEKFSESTPDDSDMYDQESPEYDQVDNCPLFATGLPSNFSSNATLAAIASLLEDDNEKLDNETKRVSQTVPNVGGGKATRIKARNRQNNPYTKPEKKKSSNTVKEIELFMKMWKP
jgi:hypothetical protein